MTRLLLVPVFLIICVGTVMAQQGTADPDYYPLGYSGKTWTGAVTAFDNQQRTLTLTSDDGKKLTFVASVPEAPYERRHDARNYKVIDFPFDKSAKYQVFQYLGPGNAGTLLPGSDSGFGKQRRNNPTGSSIGDFSDFMGRRITVYYTTREREVNGKKEKFNDVWRIRIL